MIRAAKHLDLNTCLLRVAALILKRMVRVRSCKYNDLRAAVIDMDPDADVIFLSAIHFLYLMGRIDYSSQTDAFEFIAAKGDA